MFKSRLIKTIVALAGLPILIGFLLRTDLSSLFEKTNTTVAIRIATGGEGVIQPGRTRVVQTKVARLDAMLAAQSVEKATAGFGSLSLGVDAENPLLGVLHPSIFRDAHLLQSPIRLSENGVRIDTDTAAQDEQDYIESIRLEAARNFVMSMCADVQGNIWVGTEGGGVQRFNPFAPKRHEWTQFTTRDGLGDDNGLALASDRKGRIWVGHLNHGISVYNGQKWRNYDVVGGISKPDSFSGPLGEHVCHISICPTDGDVWIATNCGLTRYSDSKGTWTNFTRSDGLPNDATSSIAFDEHGKIYIATQCDGVAMAVAADNYKTWRQVRGPDEEPTVPAGDGLPSNLVNDVLVSKAGTIYAATDAGLAWSKDSGETWQFIRGADWAEKVRQRDGGPPHGWAETPAVELAEDYCTCVVEGKRGQIYVGHRQRGVDLFDPASNRVVVATYPLFTKAIVYAGITYIGAYKTHVGSRVGGVIALDSASVPNTSRAAANGIRPADLPLGAPPPNVYELNQELAKMAAVAPLQNDGSCLVVSMDDDWRTQGDWLGRYGRYWADIATIDRYDDYLWGAGSGHVNCSVRMGMHHHPKDALRRWIESLYTDDPRVLEIPPVYMDSRVVHGYTTWDKDRRDASWDDHGEAYPMASDGPDIYFCLEIPEGTFILSLYSKSEPYGYNYCRDYEVSVRQHRGNNLQDITDFAKEPELATGRIVNFLSGVYSRFLVQGPSELTIKVARNHSYNTLLSAAMLDEVDEQPAPYFKSVVESHQTQTRRLQYNKTMITEWRRNPTQWAKQFAPCSSEEQGVEKLIEEFNAMQDWNAPWWAINRRQVSTLLARWYQASANGHFSSREIAFKASCLYQADLYIAWESLLIAEGKTPARQIEKSLRWDGVTPAYSGRGFETVSTFLSANDANFKVSHLSTSPSSK